MNIVQGDLIQLALGGVFDVVVHGCNCQCTMGAGVAKAMKTIFPEAYDADKQTPKGDRKKLGTISFAAVQREGRDIFIVNGYTQFHWRGPAILADYDAIRAVMAHVRTHFAGKRIGYPKIGAGLARGDWNTIAQIIDEELAGEDHTLVEYKA